MATTRLGSGDEDKVAETRILDNIEEGCLHDLIRRKADNGESRSNVEPASNATLGLPLVLESNQETTLSEEVALLRRQMVVERMQRQEEAVALRADLKEFQLQECAPRAELKAQVDALTSSVEDVLAQQRKDGQLSTKLQANTPSGQVDMSKVALQQEGDSEIMAQVEAQFALERAQWQEELFSVQRDLRAVTSEVGIVRTSLNDSVGAVISTLTASLDDGLQGLRLEIEAHRVNVQRSADGQMCLTSTQFDGRLDDLRNDMALQREELASSIHLQGCEWAASANALEEQLQEFQENIADLRLQIAEQGTSQSDGVHEVCRSLEALESQVMMTTRKLEDVERSARDTDACWNAALMSCKDEQALLRGKVDAIPTAATHEELNLEWRSVVENALSRSIEQSTSTTLFELERERKSMDEKVEGLRLEIDAERAVVAKFQTLGLDLGSRMAPDETVKGCLEQLEMLSSRVDALYELELALERRCHKMMENIGAEWRASVDALRNDITREERRGMEPFQNEPGSLTPDTVDNLRSDVNQLRPYVEAFREEFLKNLQTVKQDVNADWKCTVGELFERVESVAAVSATELRSTDAAWRASLKAIKDELVGLIDTTKEGLGCLVSGIETKWVSKFNSVSSVALVDEVVGHVKQGMDEMRLSLELQRKDVDGKIDSHRSLIEERLNCLKSELDEEWRSCVEACRDEVLGRIDATDPTNELRSLRRDLEDCEETLRDVAASAAQVRTAQAECQASVTAIRVESSALAVSVAATEIGLESLRNDVDSETRQADVRWKSGQETHTELCERLNAATEKLECLSKDVESDRPQVDKLREDFARNLQSMASVAFVEECAGLKSSSTEDRLRVFKQDLDFEWGTQLEDLRCEFTERNDAAVKPKQDVEAEREWRTGVEAFVRECVAHEVDAVLRTVVTKTSSTVQQELVRLRDDVEWRSAYNSCKDSLAALTKRVAENTERIGDCESSRALRETDATGGICEWQRVMDMLQNDVRQIESAVASETRQAELRWADVKEITDQFVGKLNSTTQQLECLRKDIEPGRQQMEKLREEIMRKLQSMASVAFVEECAGLKSSSTEQRLKLFKHDMDLEWRPRLEVLRCEFMGRIDAVAKQRQDIEAESREWRTSFEAFVHDHVAKEVDAVLSTVVTKTSSMVQQELGRFRDDVSVEWRTAYESCKDSLEALTRRVAEKH